MKGLGKMTNYIMLCIGCILVGASQNGMIPDFYVGAALSAGIITIVWSIIWDR